MWSAIDSFFHWESFQAGMRLKLMPAALIPSTSVDAARLRPNSTGDTGMTRLTSVHFCVFVAAIAALPAAAAEPIVVEGRVAAVTIYQGQALVTRELEVPRAQVLLEVVVTDLPEYVLPAACSPNRPMASKSARSATARGRSKSGMFD
jgi:hypothetical protein